MENRFTHSPVPIAHRDGRALKVCVCLALAASGLSPALSAPDLGPQTLSQVLELVGANLLGEDGPQVAHDEIETNACGEGSGFGWRPPDEAFTDAPELPSAERRPCAGAQVAGSGSLSHGRRATGWFAEHSVGDATFGAHPSSIGALSLPTTGAWRGADLQLLSVAWSGHQAVMGMAVQQVAGIDGTLASAPLPGADYRVGLYARDEWQLSPALAATLGLNLDHDMAGTTQLRPRVGLAWQAGPTTRVKALYGRARRASAAGERYYGDGSILSANPLSRLEQNEAFEIEAEQRISSGLKLHAMAYAWTVHDVAALGAQPGGMLQLPAGEGLEARGFELSADQVWAMGARLRGSAALQDATCANGTPLLASPQWLGKLLLSTPLPWAGLRLGYEWLYDGERIGFAGSTVGAFAQSNLNLASTQLAKGLEWSMSVLNLFDMRDPRLAAAGNGLVALEQGRRNVQMRLAYQF